MSADTRERHDWLRDISRDDPLTITARGNCMAPLIADGARLQVAPARRYYAGDVIVVRAASGGYLVHRLLGSARWRGRRLYVTRGDRSARVDGPVDAGQVLGKVCGGACSDLAVNIPLRHRISALARFARFALLRVTAPQPAQP